MPLLAGQTPTAADLNALNAITAVRKTADQAVASSTTLIDDAHLFLNVVSNATYYVLPYIIFAADTAGDMKVGWSAPAGAALDWNIGGPDSVQNTPTGIPYNAYNNLAGADTAGGIGAASFLVIRPSGILVTSSTSGTFRFRWAQGTSSVNGTTVKAGSTITLLRLA